MDTVNITQNRQVAAPLPARADTGGWQKVFGLPLAFTGLFLSILVCPGFLPSPGLAYTFLAVASVLLIWQMLVWTAAAKAGRLLLVEFRPVKSHYVQATVQFCVYAYWGWYWRRVYAEAPLILAQILFLYIFDALLSWSRGRPWRLGFGPIPIIFSTNLFMWFMNDWFIFQFLMIATGALGKEFIKWERGGRKCHIFNPSAFGLALFSLGLLLTGASRHTWGLEIATTLVGPRFIYVEIFLVGLIVQGFFGVTLVTLSAAATLCISNLIYTHVTGAYFFVDANIPIAVFLGLHLLVTDPATSPRSNVGKAVFGIGYGIGIWISYAILRRFGLPDFYDKLLVVPVLNLTVRLLDQLGAREPWSRFTRWETGFGLPRMNLIHMGCWAMLFSAMLATGFIEAPIPAMAQDAVSTPPNAPLSPGLMGKIRLILNRFGKDVALDAGLSSRLGFTPAGQPWAARQLTGSAASQPGAQHSLCIARDGKEPDLLIGLRTPAKLYIIRSHPDGTAAPGEALVTNAQTGQTVPLAPADAQASLNGEFAFWSRFADQLLAPPPKN